MTLEQIIEQERKRRHENGEFGIKACKDSIKMKLSYDKETTLFTLLGEYAERANKDVFFNKTMVLACWELINE